MLTEERVRELLEEAIKGSIMPAVTKAIQGATAATHKRFEKELERFATKPDEPTGEVGEGDEEPKDKAAGGRVSPYTRLQREMQAELAASKKRSEELAAMVKAEVTKRESLELAAALDGAMTKANISPALRPAAIALLEKQNRVKRDEGGAFVFDTGDAVTGVVALEQGLEKWAAKDGAAFLAPRQTPGGAGTAVPGGVASASNGKMSDSQLDAAIGGLFGG